MLLLLLLRLAFGLYRLWVWLCAAWAAWAARALALVAFVLSSSTVCDIDERQMECDNKSQRSVANDIDIDNQCREGTSFIIIQIIQIIQIESFWKNCLCYLYQLMRHSTCETTYSLLGDTLPVSAPAARLYSLRIFKLGSKELTGTWA